VRGAYHVAPAFDEPVGSIERLTGPQLSVTFGVTFGGR
jgi:hypothetical protein